METNQDRANGIRVIVEDPTIAALDIRVSESTKVKGTFYGAPGTFTCAGTTSPADCYLSRKETGDTNYRVTDRIPDT